MPWLLLQWSFLLPYTVAFCASRAETFPHPPWNPNDLPARRPKITVFCDASSVRDLSSPDLSIQSASPYQDGDTFIHNAYKVAQRPTTALLRVSYDGLHFTGWSCANDKTRKNATVRSTQLALEPRQRGRRRNNARSTAFRHESGFVRSVQGEIRRHLARLFGNVNIDRIIVEGCSRTDKGVHALGMVVQIYCLSESAYAESMVPSETFQDRSKTVMVGQQPSIPGKRGPYPWNSTDTTCFIPLPKPLPELASALNRMMSPDVQIMAVAEIPPLNSINRNLPFHPTLSARRKTYRYTFSVGPRHDPVTWRSVWHVRDSGDGSTWDASLLHQAAEILCGQHEFVAFQGAPRGADDKRKRIGQNTKCTIYSINTRVKSTEGLTVTYTVDITGDRFMYKMVRMITGALVGTGRKKLSLLDLKQLLSADTRLGVPEFECAPAHGLILYHVEYDEPIDWQSTAS